jgi:hypothetical protein
MEHSTHAIFIYTVDVAFMNANPQKCEYVQITYSCPFQNKLFGCSASDCAFVNSPNEKALHLYILIFIYGY